MSDNKPKWDTPGNEQSSKPNEAGDLARKHGLSPDRVQMLIDRYGHDPEQLNLMAERLVREQEQAHALSASPRMPDLGGDID